MPEAHGSKGDMLELFSDYAEDFNCCTLPHEKYYDLEAWEAKVRAGGAGGGGGAGGRGGGSGAVNLLDDAKALKQQAQASARAADAAKFAAFRAGMAPERLKELQAVESMQTALQYAFKAGNKKEVERLQRLLAPEPG